MGARASPSGTREEPHGARHDRLQKRVGRGLVTRGDSKIDALVADYLAREPDEVTRIYVLQTLNGHALARDPQVFGAVRRIFEDAAAPRTLREVAAGVLGDTEVLDDDLAKAIERFWNE